jgi:hypothetical protein
MPPPVVARQEILLTAPVSNQEASESSLQLMRLIVKIGSTFVLGRRIFRAFKKRRKK